MPAENCSRRPLAAKLVQFASMVCAAGLARERHFPSGLTAFIMRRACSWFASPRARVGAFGSFCPPDVANLPYRRTRRGRRFTGTEWLKARRRAILQPLFRPARAILSRAPLGRLGTLDLRCFQEPYASRVAFGSTLCVTIGHENTAFLARCARRGAANRRRRSSASGRPENSMHAISRHSGRLIREETTSSSPATSGVPIVAPWRV